MGQIGIYKKIEIFYFIILKNKSTSMVANKIADTSILEKDQAQIENIPEGMRVNFQSVEDIFTNNQARLNIEGFLQENRINFDFRTPEERVPAFGNGFNPENAQFAISPRHNPRQGTIRNYDTFRCTQCEYITGHTEYYNEGSWIWVCDECHCCMTEREVNRWRARSIQNEYIVHRHFNMEGRSRIFNPLAIDNGHLRLMVIPNHVVEMSYCILEFDEDEGIFKEYFLSLVGCPLINDEEIWKWVKEYGNYDEFDPSSSTDIATLSASEDWIEGSYGEYLTNLLVEGMPDYMAHLDISSFQGECRLLYCRTCQRLEEHEYRGDKTGNMDWYWNCHGCFKHHPTKAYPELFSRCMNVDHVEKFKKVLSDLLIYFDKKMGLVDNDMFGPPIRIMYFKVRLFEKCELLDYYSTRYTGYFIHNMFDTIEYRRDYSIENGVRDRDGGGRLDTFIKEGVKSWKYYHKQEFIDRCYTGWVLYSSYHNFCPEARLDRSVYFLEEWMSKIDIDLSVIAF